MIYLAVKNKRSGWLTIYHTVALLQSPRDIAVISYNSQQLLCYFEKITNFGPSHTVMSPKFLVFLFFSELNNNSLGAKRKIVY